MKALFAGNVLCSVLAILLAFTDADSVQQTMLICACVFLAAQILLIAIRDEMRANRHHQLKQK